MHGQLTHTLAHSHRPHAIPHCSYVTKPQLKFALCPTNWCVLTLSSPPSSTLGYRALWTVCGKRTVNFNTEFKTTVNVDEFVHILGEQVGSVIMLEVSDLAHIPDEDQVGLLIPG